MALVCAELATAMPVNGGLVKWIEEAFGRFVIVQVIDVTL